MNIPNFINLNPILFYSIIAIASLVIVAKSSDLLVYGISNYARRLGVSNYLIGFLIVSIGTALPELVASINASLLKQGEMVFGTILGSNIFKIPLLGLVVLIGRKIKINKAAIGNVPITTFFLAMLPALLIIDKNLSRIDGVILLAAFFIYIANLWHTEGKLGKMKKNVKLKHIYKDSIIFIGALIALLLSARWLVHSSIIISEILKIPPYFIGLIVIGVGASMPELTVQIRSIFKHSSDLALGNVLGSIVANSSFVLGLTALINPFFINIRILIPTLIFLIIGILFVLIITGKNEINWKHGLILIAIYIAFLLFEFLF